MTNYSIIRKIDKLVNDDDLVIFLGEDISRVAFNFDKTNYVYVNNNAINFSFLLGIINQLDCRVFVFCDSDYVIQYFNSFIEIQKYCRNRKVFIFVLRNKFCDNVFNCMIHPQASFFNIGFKSYKATPYFNTSEDVLKLKTFMRSSRGSSVFMVEFDNDVFDKYFVDFPNNYFIKNKLKEFRKSLVKEE